MATGLPLLLNFMMMFIQKKAHPTDRWLESVAKLAVSFNVFEASVPHQCGMISLGKIFHPL